MKPVLVGHSGFDLCVSKDNGVYLFTKSTVKDSVRLKAQCMKQKKFHRMISSHSMMNLLFRIPCVVSESDGKGYSFSMEYVHGDSILGLIEHGKIDSLDYIVECLVSFVRWELSFCKRVPFDSSVFIDKINSIEGGVGGKGLKSFFNRLRVMASELDGVWLPMGLCHGDFTFSNMIFGARITLIDFLDSFVESPLNDMGKLCQEVDLYWSLRMSPSGVFDEAKMIVGYEYLRGRLSDEFRFVDVDSGLFLFFRVLTLTRILPYCKDELLFDDIKKCCLELIK